MKETPLVSIALCTYNGQMFLSEQIDSLVRQDYKNIEIIAVDDCSQDKTIDILKRYQRDYSFIKIYRNNINLGFTGNFERALNLCNGDYIALCDQDDIWLPSKIRKQMEVINGNEFVYHDSTFIAQDGNLLGRNMSDVVNLYRGNKPEVFLFFNCVSGHSILMKKDLLKYALPFPRGFFHDWWLAYVATNIGRIDFINEPLILYRQHDNSDTNILRLKRGGDKYTRMPSAERMQKEKAWLNLCASFNYNKHPELIKKILDLYEKRTLKKFDFHLPEVLIKNLHTLFFINKKSFWSKLNFVRKRIKVYHKPLV